MAVRFLERVRDGKLDLESDKVIAISPYITDEKREMIKKSIELLSEQIGSGKLVVGDVRIDGDFAAVIVKQTGGMDYFKMQVFPIALVKGETGWRAAPIPASFENAVLAYTVSNRERLSVLEEWMMKQRVSEIENLLEQAAERLRGDINSLFKKQDVSAYGLRQIYHGFQKAYQEGRQLEVLGYLGGYAEQWPADWEFRVGAIQAALNPKIKARHPWRLLASEDVCRVVVNEEVDGNRGMLSVACLDPSWVAGAPGLTNQLQIIHFKFEKDSGGKWVLSLPESLMSHDSELFIESQGMDGDLLDRFPKRLRKEHPALFGATLEQAEQQVISGLESGDITELMRWVQFSEDASQATETYEVVAKNWWSIHAPGMFRTPIKVAGKVKGDWAVSVYQWLSLNQAERIEFTPFFFRKTEQGWAWVTNSMSQIEKEVLEEFSAWMNVEENRWKADSPKHVMEPIIQVDGLTTEKQADDAEVTGMVERWIKALEKNNIRELLSMSARLEARGPVSYKIFRNLAYQLGIAQEVDSEMSGIYRAGNWTAAGVAHGQGNDRFFSFMLIVPTKAGFRILSEIDLISEDNRTRKFLNKVSLDRLKPFVAEGELEKIKRLYEEFEKNVRR